jgi:hypothetical protein
MRLVPALFYFPLLARALSRTAVRGLFAHALVQ